MTSTRLGGVLLAAAALFTTAVTTAFTPVSTPTTDRPGRSTVVLVVHSHLGEVDTVRLHCDPPGGTHPHANTACAELVEAGGDFSELTTGPRICTMELRPVTARANGHWAGEFVGWQRQYSNPCMLHAATGSVFDF